MLFILQTLLVQNHSSWFISDIRLSIFSIPWAHSQRLASFTNLCQRVPWASVGGGGSRACGALAII